MNREGIEVIMDEEVGSSLTFHEAELKTCKNAHVVFWLYEQLRQSLKMLNMGCEGGCREFNMDVYSDNVRFKCTKCEDTTCKVTPVPWNDEEEEWENITFNITINRTTIVNNY